MVKITYAKHCLLRDFAWIDMAMTIDDRIHFNYLYFSSPSLSIDCSFILYFKINDKKSNELPKFVLPNNEYFYGKIENNMEQFAFDAARGEGETIYTIAGILNVPAEQVAHISKTHFNEIFASENVEVLAVAEEVLQLLNIQAA